MKSVLTLDQVSFRYTADPVLESVSLEIHRGDYVGIIGENGGGKTTLLRLFIGELEPLQGTIRLLGEPLQETNLKKIGYVPQLLPQTGLRFPIQCQELVALGLSEHLRGRFFLRRSEKERVHFAMEQMGIANLAKRDIHTLSGGQRQRVYIAKALINAPEILLFDEPTVGVDAQSKQRFFDILDHLSQRHGITILMVTHETEMGQAHWKRTLRVHNHRVEEVC